jgi:hypothetical protein
MRPFVAPVAQLLHQRPFGPAERTAEHVVPGLPHQLQEAGHVPLRDRLGAEHWVFGEAAHRVHA